MQKPSSTDDLKRVPDLVLASTSRYRQALLARLGIPFRVTAPDVDETRGADEAPEALVRRLAQAKASSVAAGMGAGVVIGSDQVAVLEGNILGKPGSHTVALGQLRNAAGKTAEFLTAVSVLSIAGKQALHHVDHTRVVFKPLRDEQIERYLRREKPYDCAGSFKCEGLGIALFESIETVDPTALTGLPLI